MKRNEDLHGRNGGIFENGGGRTQARYYRMEQGIQKRREKMQERWREEFVRQIRNGGLL